MVYMPLCRYLNLYLVRTLIDGRLNYDFLEKTHVEQQHTAHTQHVEQYSFGIV